MNKSLKSWLLGFFSCYLFAGFLIGAGLAHEVPATNAFGVTYIALIWPVWLAQPWTLWEPPIPNGVFTFNEDGK